jgi:hypothetical protein
MYGERAENVWITSGERAENVWLRNMTWTRVRRWHALQQETQPACMLRRDAPASGAAPLLLTSRLLPYAIYT